MKEIKDFLVYRERPYDVVSILIYKYLEKSVLIFDYNINKKLDMEIMKLDVERFNSREEMFDCEEGQAYGDNSTHIAYKENKIPRKYEVLARDCENIIKIFEHHIIANQLLSERYQVINIEDIK